MAKKTINKEGESFEVEIADDVKTKRLHKNEQILLHVDNGYFFQKGNGVVYFRSHEEVENYHAENQIHAEEVIKLPVRSQSGRGI